MKELSDSLNSLTTFALHLWLLCRVVRVWWGDKPISQQWLRNTLLLTALSL